MQKELAKVDSDCRMVRLLLCVTELRFWPDHSFHLGSMEVCRFAYTQVRGLGRKVVDHARKIIGEGRADDLNAYRRHEKSERPRSAGRAAACLFWSEFLDSIGVQKCYSRCIYVPSYSTSEMYKLFVQQKLRPLQAEQPWVKCSEKTFRRAEEDVRRVRPFCLVRPSESHSLCSICTLTFGRQLSVFRSSKLEERAAQLELLSEQLQQHRALADGERQQREARAGRAAASAGDILNIELDGTGAFALPHLRSRVKAPLKQHVYVGVTGMIENSSGEKHLFLCYPEEFRDSSNFMISLLWRRIRLYFTSRPSRTPFSELHLELDGASACTVKYRLNRNRLRFPFGRKLLH
jgi:hypothetical protein